ncbi:MAG: hypothetical protein F4Y45_02450 [Acidobacteria bacterium]|nr:hypothetical protein [Acidobacteriota bacterium]MYD71260.1 hypothetical protein [Acidobacteriota bacterium]MYJ03956.1 hypothetical protein [Acidobacteriota bacterium]
MDFAGASRLESRLAALDSPVRLVFFTQTFGCDSCLMARQIVDRIVAASDQLTVVEHNLVLDKDEAARYGVDRAPALAVVGGDDDGGAGDVGFRYYGVPAGFEMESIVEAIELVAAGGAAAVAAGKSALSDETLDTVDALDRDVNLRVFVTPT